MKSTFLAFILSIVFTIMPIGHLKGTPAEPLLTNFTLIKLAPENNYMPTESELSAVKVSIENHLSILNLYNCTVTSDTNDNIIRVFIPQQSGNKNSTPEEIATELCRKIEIKFLDPEGSVILEGKHINKCFSGYDTITPGHYIVCLEFNEEGKKRLADATARLIGQELTISLDGEVISSPIVEEVIPNGEAVINRIDTGEEALEIAGKITAGMMPYELVVIETMQNKVP